MEADSAVWSRYQTIHDFVSQPIHAVINLVGSQEMHGQLSEIIQTGLQQTIWLPKPTPNYAKPRYRIQSYDLPCECDRLSRQVKAGISSGEIGYLKQNFFTSFGYTKPALTIFVFDYRTVTSMDWKVEESKILGQIKEHSEKWQTNITVPSKYMLIFMFPNLEGLSVEECRNSFKKSVQLSGDEHIKSSNYFLTTGFEALKGGMQKKFSKNVNDLVVQYYREKKDSVKRKQKRLIQG